MSKQVTITSEDKVYTLTFTRKTVEMMERQGFNLNDLQNKPITMLPMLFSGAFLARHKYIKRDAVDALLDSIPNKQEMFDALAEMYTDTITSLMDSAEDAVKNVSWEKSF